MAFDIEQAATPSPNHGHHEQQQQQEAGAVSKPSSAGCGPDTKLYEFKKQLLLLATLVATVTYVAGLNLPGGVWQQDASDGHPAGDPILRDTHYRRYLALYYCNGTALAASLVVCLILVILEKKSKPLAVVLRVVMVLDLLGLMGAYAAGSCRDVFTTAYSSVLAFLVLAYIAYAFFSYLIYEGRKHKKNHDHSNQDQADQGVSTEEDKVHEKKIDVEDKVHEKEKIVEDKVHEKEKIDVLMLLATFAVTITYVAGLSPPGGFWSSTQDGHRVSDPVLEDRGSGGRYRVFFVCNTTAFAACLLIIVLLLDKKVTRKSGTTIVPARFIALYGLIAVALLGLVGAYASGSCRKSESTVKVALLTAAVPTCVCLQLAVTRAIGAERCKTMHDDCVSWFKGFIGTPAGTSEGTDQHLQDSRYLVLFLATLVVTITYQAGLDPPGGLWPDDQDGHKVGHPVLQTTHPTRYKVFFYSNSAAFVTSLVVIMMLQSKYLLKRHTLEAAMVLDLFGLITAYAAGSTREVNTSVYVVALAGLVLVYVVVHITIRDHDTHPEDDAVKKKLDDKRQVLLLLAILAATLTYQAGLTPPGGFWSADDDKLGRHAGFPVLLDNYPRRYNAFFYCNATSFMASVTLILLLVNPKLYGPGIRCYALYVCMVVGTFGLMGAYAAGSSRHLKTSIYVLTLAAAVLAFIASIFWIVSKRWWDKVVQKDNITKSRNKEGQDKVIQEDSTTESKNKKGQDKTVQEDSTTESKNKEGQDKTVQEDSTTESRNKEGQDKVVQEDDTTESRNKGEQDKIAQGDDTTKEKYMIEYLMLLGILAASVTYQTGLKPPGGLWQDNSNGHSAGNPILHDINKRRYNAFFYSNSTSFVASIMVIVMLLPLTMLHDQKLILWPMHTVILLDMLSLLLAYAAGSTRKWEASRNVIFLIIPVLAYVALYATVAIFFQKKRLMQKRAKPTSVPPNATDAKITTPHTLA